MKVETFKVRCPMDNDLHDAVAHISEASEPPFVLFTECHKSWECDTCDTCKIAMREKYERGELSMGKMEKPL